MIKTRFLKTIRGLAPASACVVALCTAVSNPVQAADNIARISDPADLPDTSGDIRSVSAQVKGDYLHLTMTVEGTAAPAVEQTPAEKVNRYYYHWLLDTDNNPATGRSNAEYEGSPTGVTNAIGAERVVMIGWRDGKPNGVEVYDPANEDVAILSGFTFQASGNTLTAMIPLAPLGLAKGQTIAVSAFQEGASDDWKVDWAESQTMTLEGPALAQASVSDPAEMADASGDIRNIGMYVEGANAVFTMTLEGIAAPALTLTPEGMVNRYYYHWLLDTDNNPATGRSNAEYEGTPTGVTNAIGAERVIMIGWRDGKPNGVEVYDPANEDVPIVVNFPFQASGNTLTATVPLSNLGVAAGQTVALSAFQEGASDGWAVDWVESQTVSIAGPTGPAVVVQDPKDLGDTSGDVRRLAAHVDGTDLKLSMTVEAVAAPSTGQTVEGMVNRYYYHWLLDTDNNPATGRSNAEYEGTPTGVTNAIGAERVIMIGWRDGKPNGVEVYDPANEDVPIVVNFPFQASGNTLTATIPLATLGLATGQTIAVSGFQEGASEGWLVDWLESQVLTLDPLLSERMRVDGNFADWADAGASGLVTSVTDSPDMADSSGDIRSISATVEAGYLYLRMDVEGTALPAVDQTPEGMVNRYYYHWLLDTDNNPATGRSNAEYEGNPTGVTTPIGAERVIMLGWRDGQVNGREVYDPANEDVALASDFDYASSSNSVEVRIRLADLGVALGQTVALSAFQEGASDGWAVDWMESKTITLAESGGSGITLENVFSADAYGFEFQVTDASPLIVNTSTVVARLDGVILPATVRKDGAVTTVSGKFPSLLAPNSQHRVNIALTAGNQPQAKDFAFVVEPYTVLPSGSRLASVNTTQRGFLTKVTQISNWQDVNLGPSVHSNRADLAELQLAGSLTNEFTGLPYINEADEDWTTWRLTPITNTGPVNWFEQAPEVQASLNFTNDQPLPKLNMAYAPFTGVAMELLTYLHLPEGEHKIGLYTEGGHKVNAGLTAADPVLSIFDNSGEVPVVPTYYGRSQFFNVVAPETGYYPMRFVWFQERRGQEPALMLELFSVEDRQLHLLNDDSDPKSIRAYLAGALIGQILPTVAIQRQGDNLVITFSGTLESADTPNGTWANHPVQTSPVSVPMTGTAKFFRARGN